MSIACSLLDHACRKSSGKQADDCMLLCRACLPLGVGEVKLAAFPGGLHIWVALGSQQLMFDVVLDGAQLGQPCPTRPVLVTLPPTAAVSAVGMVQPARGQAGQHGSRRGQLRVVGDEAVFIAA